MPVTSVKSSAVLLTALLSAGLYSHVFAAEAPAPAAAQVPESPRFDINAFDVSGDTLLGSAQIQALVAPFVGKAKDFGDVQQALEALQEAYRDKGYSSVRVTLPEQELDNGSVKLQIFEQKIHKITLEGNQNYPEENVMMALPSLKAGELPNVREISKTLKIANQNPTKQTAVLFKDSEAVENSIEATVKVVDEKPWKAFVNLDNTGSRESGHARLSVGYQHFNLFGLDHRVTAQYITTPHTPNELFSADKGVKIVALAYTIPLYNLGDSIDLMGVYSDSTSSIPESAGVSFGDVSANGTVFGVKYNHNLPKIKTYDHQVSLSIDNRATRKTSFDIFNNNVFLFTQVNEAITTTPLGLTYSGVWAPGDEQLSFAVSAIVNLKGWAKHGDSRDFDNYLADDNFKKFTFNVDYIKTLPKDWQLHANISGQRTSDHLAPIEQFRAGGAASVRGFRESIISGDEGERLSLEVISPNFGQFIAAKADLRAVIFTDYGHVQGNSDTSGGDPSPSVNIHSVGAGLRFNVTPHFSSKVEVGRVIDDDYVGTTVGTRIEGDMFAHVSLGWQW